MSIANEIQRLQTAKADIKSAIEEKGVTVGDGTIDTYAEKISEISGGGSYYDEFWDNFQENGNRMDYSYAFCGNNFDEELFKPKYDIKPTNAYCMFQKNKNIKNLKALLEEQGLVLDTSECTNFNSFINESEITHLGVIDARNATDINYIFRLSKIEYIEKFILSEKTKGLQQNCFSNCYYLKHIIFEGTIAFKLGVANSKNIDHESLMSLINALKDYSEDASGTVWKVELGPTNIAKLTEDEINIANEKGWQVF